MRQEGPSVEDILQSIKRVMERDEQGTPHRPGMADDHPPEPVDNEEAEEVLGLAESDRELASSDAADTNSLSRGSDALTSQEAGVAMRRSLAALELLAASGGSGGDEASSLDATVRDMLRPMLAEWLEAHLPAIVDRQVRSEIARIVGEKS